MSLEFSCKTRPVPVSPATVTVMEIGDPVTVSVAEPATPDSVAEIVLMPGATAVARPVAEMVTSVVAEDAQVAVALTSLVEPSL